MRLSSIFSKSDAHNLLGLCLRQHTVAYCALNAQDKATFAVLEAIDKNYVNTLKVLSTSLSSPHQCHLVLQAQQSQIVQVDKPNIPEQELLEALKWQIKDLVSIAPDDMVLDYFDGPTMAGGIEKLHVVCAAKSDLVPIVETLDKQDIVVKSISIEEFAFASLIPESENACLLVCQQPDEEMLVLIVKQGRLYFYRRLRGMAKIGEKSAEELDSGIIDALSLEIQRSVDYYERQLKQAPIREIQVLIPVEQEALIARKLAENTHLPVNIFALSEQVVDNKAYSACYGALVSSEATGALDG